jgi:hypothetical protein
VRLHRRELVGGATTYCVETQLSASNKIDVFDHLQQQLDGASVTPCAR